MDKKLHKKLTTENLITDIIVSGLQRNTEKVEMLSITLSRILKGSDPDTATKINNIIKNHTNHGSIMRGAGPNPIPVDNDTQLEMATIIEPRLERAIKPVLSKVIEEKVNNFLMERSNVSLLLEKDIRPTSSILVIGPPGTGKTMLAAYLANVLEKNLVILDLAASISSLLGKTGHNLKRVLKYARQTSSVLLLDEFDAIAKRRDDPTDLGELKRVVNVLLMEMEVWPISSVLIATSNHPELLDKAIWRRFDHVFELNLPEQQERNLLLRQNFSNLLQNKDSLFSNILPAIADLLEEKSAADICKFCENVKRRVVLKKESASNACVEEISLFLNDNDNKVKGKFCKLAKDTIGNSITVRELADVTGLSPSGVQYYLKK